MLDTTHKNEMQQVRQHKSKVLGQVRGMASSHIDVSISKELGWGAHTLSVGCCTYSKLGYDNQPAAFYASDDALLIIPVADKNDVYSVLLRSHRQEAQVVLPFRRIDDIQVQRKVGGAEERGAKQKVFSSEEEETRRERIAVTLKKSGDVVLLDCHESPVFARHVLAAFSSYRVLVSSRLGRLAGNASPKLAFEYLGEVTRDLSDCLRGGGVGVGGDKEKGGRKGGDDLLDKTIDKMGEVFEEFFDECLLDLHLKENALRTREFVVQSLAAISLVLSAPSGVENDVDIKLKYANGGNGGGASQPTSPTKLFGSPSSSSSSSADRTKAFNFSSVDAGSASALSAASSAVLQARLHGIIVKRLGLIRRALLALAALVFSSESVSCRGVVLSGPPPLDMDSWFAVLSRDCFADLCKLFKCGPDGVLSSPSWSTSQPLGFLLQSIRDVQTVLMVELADVGSTAYTPPTRIGISRQDHYFDLAPAVFGDVFVRQSRWDVVLEEICLRVGSLLDDMIGSERAEMRGAGGGLRGAGGRGGLGGVKGGGRGGVNADVSSSSSSSGLGYSSGKVSVPRSPRTKTPSKFKAVPPLLPESAGKPLAHSPIETQEILLLKFCQLLRALAWDSAKVREALASDLLPLFLPVLALFNVVCPRRTAAAAAAARGSARLQAAGAGSGLPDLPAAISVTDKFMRCLAGSSRAGSGTGSSVHPQTSSVKSPMHGDATAELFPWIPLDQYGAESLQIEPSSWRLVHLARRALEECINVLDVAHLTPFVEAAAVGGAYNGPYKLEISPRPLATTLKGEEPALLTMPISEEAGYKSSRLKILTSEMEDDPNENDALLSYTSNGAKDRPRAPNELGSEEAPLLKIAQSPIRAGKGGVGDRGGVGRRGR